MSATPRSPAAGGSPDLEQRAVEPGGRQDLQTKPGSGELEQSDGRLNVAGGVPHRPGEQSAGRPGPSGAAQQSVLHQRRQGAQPGLRAGRHRLPDALLESRPATPTPAPSTSRTARTTLGDYSPFTPANRALQRPPALAGSALGVGGGLQAQSDYSVDYRGVSMRQGGYALVNMRLGDRRALDGGGQRQQPVRPDLLPELPLDDPLERLYAGLFGALGVGLLLLVGGLLARGPGNLAGAWAVAAGTPGAVLLAGAVEARPLLLSLHGGAGALFGVLLFVVLFSGAWSLGHDDLREWLRAPAQAERPLRWSACSSGRARKASTSAMRPCCCPLPAMPPSASAMRAWTAGWTSTRPVAGCCRRRRRWTSC